MKQLILLVTTLALTFGGCTSQYPALDDGLYAEFVTNKGTFVAKFYHESTPLTVANFIELAQGTHPQVDSAYQNKPFYDGLTFHRVIKDFMIQGGDPKGDGTGNPGYAFADEIVDSLSHKAKGILSMANSGPATNGSQFFITLKETPWLDGKHTVFGEIVLGQEIVDSIGQVATSKPGDKPNDPLVIQSIQIINKGVTAPSFAGELAKIESNNQEKAERVAGVISAKKIELDLLEETVDAYPSGIKIHWNHQGKGMKPALGANVRFNYAGYLTDGVMFDTSILSIAEAYEQVNLQRKANNQYQPMMSQYSQESALVPGFKEGLLEMSIGDRITLFIPSHLAWGPQGAGSVIPPNSDVIFELELLSAE